MRALASVVLAASVAACLPSVALAKVKIAVDLDSQTIHVEGKDKTYDWKISSGASGYETPTGDYKVLWTDKDHKSDEYDGAPMPNAIFFKPGFAIHGSPKSNWGHPASHGCVRLQVKNSAILFAMVKAEGGAEISITGTAAPTTIEASNPRRRDAAADDYAAGAPYGTYQEPGYRDAATGSRGPYGYGEYREAPAPASAGYEQQAPASGGLDGLFRGLY